MRFSANVQPISKVYLAVLRSVEHCEYMLVSQLMGPLFFVLGMVCLLACICPEKLVSYSVRTQVRNKVKTHILHSNLDKFQMCLGAVTINNSMSVGQT